MRGASAFVFQGCRQFFNTPSHFKHLTLQHGIRLTGSDRMSLVGNGERGAMCWRRTTIGTPFRQGPAARTCCSCYSCIVRMR